MAHAVTKAAPVIHFEAEINVQLSKRIPMSGDPRIPRGMTEPLAPAALSKGDLRTQLLAARRALDAPTRAAWDLAIGEQVVAWWRGHRSDTLGVYWPLRDEPNLHAAYAELARLGVRLLLPVVVEKHAALEFAEWQIGEAMVKDAMGVAVPAQLRMAAYPPALLVPCLGFNRQGYRLGYGGGFYDRTLARAPRPRTVGVAYACLQVEFAGDGHDVALDDIITEHRTPGSDPRV
jgi:5,10-methenyltetrahydrofolate synthetase